MTPEQLKASILQYAIQGKLIEQRLEEGTGEELYRQIQEEKQRLIKEGKIKKEKALPEITEDEIPFDIPKTWCWIRLGELIRVIGGVSYKKGDVIKNGIRILRGGNIQSMKVLTDEDDVFLPHEYRDDEKQVKIGDILIVASTGSKAVIGKAGYVDREMPCTMIGAFLRICRPIYFETVEYLRCLFDSDFYRKHIRDLSQGTNINNVKESYITEFVIPFPPLTEQKRIVAKIEELLPYVDRYAAAYEKLEQFNAKFPEDMKKSILQFAIQGKLVEQRPEEGTGEELYRQIVKNRELLIERKVIKRDKRTETAIDPNAIPFDVPENWKWVTLGSILNKLTDGTHKTPKYTTDGIKFVSVKDMSNGVLSLENTKFISAEEHQELYARCNPEKGDILLSKVGTTGVPAIVNTTEQFSLFVSVALLKFDRECIDLKFLYYMLMSPLVQTQATENTRGVGNKNWVLDAIANTMVVLPPLAEQKRIVAKLEEILPLCERLK